MPREIILTPAQTDFILTHKDTLTAAELAAGAGITTGTLFRRLHRLCPGHVGRLAAVHKWRRDTVREAWPHMSAREIEEKYGINRRTAANIARRCGWSHDPATAARLLRKKSLNLSHHMGAERERKRTARFRLTRRMEELRVLSGMPQRTKFRFASAPRRVHAARHRLAARFRLLQDCGDAYTLIITPASLPVTRWGKPAEDWYARRYGFRFIRRD